MVIFRILETNAVQIWTGAIRAYFYGLSSRFRRMSSSTDDKCCRMLSLCHELWQAILAQGFCIGLGGGCLFLPAVAILPTYFRKRLGLAVGVAASGSSLGGVIYPIMFYKLIGEVGFGWGVRILGFMALATQMIPLAFMKMRFKPPKARQAIDLTAFRDGPYTFFVFGCILGFVRNSHFICPPQGYVLNTQRNALFLTGLLCATFVAKDFPF